MAADGQNILRQNLQNVIENLIFGNDFYKFTFLFTAGKCCIKQRMYVHFFLSVGLWTSVYNILLCVDCFDGLKFDINGGF